MMKWFCIGCLRDIEGPCPLNNVYCEDCSAKAKEGEAIRREAMGSLDATQGQLSNEDVQHGESGC